jgi:hypothetical protein
LSKGNDHDHRRPLGAPCFFFGRHLSDELPTTKLWRVALGTYTSPQTVYDDDDDDDEPDAKTG